MGQAAAILGLIIAVPLAAKAVYWFYQKALNGADHVVNLRKAVDIVLYELVPNEGNSIKDNTTEAVRIATETQRALENHLTDHP